MSEKLIYESEKSKIYFQDESEWGIPVVMKILNYEFPTPNEISQFYNEFDIIEGIEIPGIRKVLKKTKAKNRHAIYFEWVEANTLRNVFKNKQNDIVDFLHIAIAIAQTLSEIHQNSIIHKDINPSNILVDLQKRLVKIIDFGISTKIDSKLHNLSNPENLEGTLSYNSPEQTGRMNRKVDYRSDLYSLGVTLFEVLTGRLPFETKDAMELVHCHIAIKPPKVNSLNPSVPLVLSDIIDHLLSKNAEDRYQSASGLKHDLEVCLREFEVKKDIPNFELKQNDFSGKFQIPQKLYGREEEIDFLLKAFERCADGFIELVLVKGYSGTGKSVLVREVHKPITHRKGYFIEGKYDQFQRAVPYFAILQAFKDYINILLSEKEEVLKELKEKIQLALGSEGKVLTDVIPNLEYIIGKQPDVPEIGGSESQNRFNYVFRKFVSAISTKEHPLVIFIDDLQWADSASLSLLNVLLTDKKNGNILFIGAYRDNEVNASHPFIITLNEIEEKGAKVSSITIDNLSKENINELISESVNEDKNYTRGLTDLTFEKTNGNAFFVTQFLLSLYAEKLLVFNNEIKRWEWEIERIKSLNITDNVVELMAVKIQKLPIPTQQAMKFASCIGNSFPISTLSQIYQKDIETTQSDLFEAMKEGLMIQLGDQVKFSHDRIQQAVYSLIPSEERNIMHWNIGKLLYENSNTSSQEDQLFDIVNQWNFGKEMIQSKEEIELLTNLNLRAGIKAKQSSAFKPAFDYLTTGIGLLQQDPWKNQYAMCLELYTYATEAAYLNGDFVAMDKMFKEVISNAKDLLEKVKPYEIRILAYKAENKLLDAIKTGLELLSQLGEKFPSNPNMLNVMGDLIKTKIKLYGKDNAYIENLPVMTDAYKIAAMRIIADIASSSYWATPTLFPLLIFRMVHLSLKYGNTAVSAFGFATYGVIMCGVLGDMKSGHSFGKLGLVLLEKFNAKEWKTQIYTPIYALIINWNEHVHNTLRPLQESYHIGLETGAIEFACINTNIYCIHSYLSGKRLHRLEEETKAYSESFLAFKQETNYNYNEVYRQPMLNFMGHSANPTVLTGEAYDEEKMMAQNTERNDKTGTFFIHFNKMILCYYFQDYERALFHAAESRKLLEAVLAKFEIPNHHLYEALTMLALYSKASSGDQSKYMKQVKSNLSKMKKWAKDAPENYLHKVFLIEAEINRVLGKNNEARTLYDKAIEGASNNDYIHEEALAYELAGKFYLDQKSKDLTEFYFKASYNAYREWGAEAKLRNLEQNYPKFVTGVLRRDGVQGETTITNTSKVNNALLDIKTVLKAATAISGEIILPKLLTKLMNIVIENAGAEYGILILEKDGELFVEAQLVKNNVNIEVLQHIPVDGSKILCESIVKYVKRTGESVVINDAVNDVRYENDAYIKMQKPKSIIAIPVYNQGKFIGVFYLGNDLTVGAFTQDRIDMLSLLSGQIAVSIDNAILYEQMDQKVKDRTQELAIEKKKSDDLLYNILPEEIADELKRDGRTKPRQYESATVLFTDFKGFTMISEKLTAQELVDEIDLCFGKFDEIMGRHGIEKIKTIGDAYMCVGGIPVHNSTHAIDCIKAAREILEWITVHSKERKEKGQPIFEIRIGLHSGPLVAGVVGSKKFAFDIWGDTVNTASRMESSGEAGKINISGSTYELIKNKFNCTYRGKISAKNKGEIDMYFVEGEKN